MLVCLLVELSPVCQWRRGYCTFSAGSVSLHRRITNTQICNSRPCGEASGMGLPGRVAFFVPSSVPLCICETGWERLGPYRRAYAPFPFFCPYFSFSICISPRFVVSLHRQRKHACVSFFHFSSPSLPPKPGNGVPSGLNEPMKRPLLDCRSAQTSFQVWPFWMIVWAG